MRIAQNGRSLHLTYCTNVHPGERLVEIEGLFSGPLRAVKTRACPDQPMGLGLWMPAAALSLLERDEEQVEAFASRLAEEGFYLFTLNGFPYGRFHGTRIKESVYQPDWRRSVRVSYTCALADLLVRLLPEDLPFGSISTVPGTTRILADEAACADIVAHLLEAAAHLHRLRAESGKTVVLALEPEPGCLLQSSGDVLAFFEDRLFASGSCRLLGERLGLSPAAAEEVARRHLGLCFDVCHFAVVFEDPAEALETIARAGIRIAKLQLSCALRISPVGEEGRKLARRFNDGVYLHQTVVRKRNGGLAHFLDLPSALACGIEDEEEWRVHVHLPIDRTALSPPLETTQGQLRAAVEKARELGLEPHFEVETYNFDVLPEELRDLPLEEAILRELSFARELLLR